MAKTRIGLDVGSSVARIAEVTEGDRPTVERLGQIPLPAGAVEGGEVRRSDEVAKAIRELVEASGIEPGDVHLGVANARIVVRDITIPWLPVSDMRQALSFQVADYVPLAADDTYVDYVPLGEQSVEGQRMQRLLLVASPRQPVNALLDAVESAGLSPVGVDLSAFAAVRAVASGDAAEAAAVVDIGAHLTSVTLHRGGEVRLVRFLPVGGRSITKAVAQDLGVDAKTAELLKRGEAAGEGSEMARARGSALAAATPIAEEIVSTIEFSMRQAADLGVDRIVLTGAGAHLPGLEDIFHARSALSVGIAPTFGRVASGLGVDVTAAVEMRGGFSVAIGLALEDLRRARSGKAA